MSWIEYYLILLFSWFFILTLLLISDKTRFFSISLILTTCIFFVGIKIIESSSSKYTLYQDYKKESFLKSVKDNKEVVLNILPTSWLQHMDNRKKNSIIPIKYREQIGGFFPLGSAPNLFTFYCAEDENFISYKTDRFGFRNNDNLWNINKHDLIITGDSFSESACVKTPMQDYFNTSLKIVSLGKGGNGPLTSLAVMREYLESYKTKIIYHLISDNDFSRPEKHGLEIDLNREWDETQLQNYLNDKDYTIKYFSSLDLSKLKYFAIDYTKQIVEESAFVEKDIINKAAYLFSFYFIKKNLLTLMNLFSKKSDDKTRLVEINKLKKVYKEMIKTTYQKNTKLKFVILPTKSYCTSNKAHKFLADVLREIKIEPLDLTFKLCDLKYFTVHGNHFNSYGYKKLSEYINADYNLQFN